MTKEVEDIIKNKAYTELTPDERNRVGDLANNEEEYENMQWFLIAAASTLETTKIKASPKVKEKVMEHLSVAGEKKGFWLNSVGVFMLPKGEPFYKKPLVQLGVAAAVVIGFLAYFNQTIPKDNFALNDPMPREEIHVVEAEENTEQPVEILENTERQEDFTRTVNTLDEKSLPGVSSINEELENRNGRNDVQGISELVEELQLEEMAINKDQSDDETEEGVKLFNEAVAEESDLVNDNVVSVLETRKRADRLNKEAEVAAPMADLESKEVNTNVQSTAGSGVGSYSKAQEEIVPKSLYIEKTKELNELFFIVK